MRPYTLLYIASGWVILVALLALPRGLKAILVILGGVFVLVIAYGMHQKVRHKYLQKPEMRTESAPEQQPIEPVLKTDIEELPVSDSINSIESSGIEGESSHEKSA